MHEVVKFVAGPSRGWLLGKHGRLLRFTEFKVPINSKHALALIVLLSSAPASADVVYLLCEGHARYSNGRITDVDVTAVVFDLDRRVAFFKEDGEAFPITEVSPTRIAWRNPKTANRLTSSEGQFSPVSMSGREFYRYNDGRGSWTNYFENCRKVNPRF